MGLGCRPGLCPQNENTKKVDFLQFMGSLRLGARDLFLKRIPRGPFRGMEERDKGLLDELRDGVLWFYVTEQVNGLCPHCCFDLSRCASKVHPDAIRLQTLTYHVEKNVLV